MPVNTRPTFGGVPLMCGLEDTAMPSNDRDPNAPVGVDTTRASVARVYDYLLGGKNHYEIDRETAAQVTAAMPDLVELAKENRAFLNRVARFLALKTGITQYLDCGSGLPTAENTHELVQRHQRDATVVYVDHDPVVTAHGRALLEDNDWTHFVEEDIFNPRGLLDYLELGHQLDFDEPVAMLFIATLHHYQGDRHRPGDIMREYIDALPSGSYVAISHILDPEDEDAEAMRAFENAVASGSLGGATARTRSEIADLFTGLELVEPGVVTLPQWWPDGPRTQPLGTAQRLIAGGVGRKP